MSGRIVLLIEPDRALGGIYVRALERAGYGVMIASSAHEAILAADHQAPDIIVMEWELPGHNGGAFLYEMRSHHDWTELPIIIHTSISPQELEEFSEAFGALGVREVLHKSSHRLQTLINRVSEHAPIV